MASAPLLGSKETVGLDPEVFEAPFNGPLVHECVRAELAARRQGTAATRTRGMRSGGSAKPWRQKGTGRARAGSSRSPVWKGGGIVFGPQPRGYVFKVNRKARRVALRSALSLHASRDSLRALDPAPFEEPGTARAAKLLAPWERAGSTLVVLAEEEARAALSFRNLPGVAVAGVAEVGIADLVGAGALLASRAALDALTARAKKAVRAETGAEVTP